MYGGVRLRGVGVLVRERVRALVRGRKMEGGCLVLVLRVPASWSVPGVGAAYYSPPTHTSGWWVGAYLPTESAVTVGGSSNSAQRGTWVGGGNRQPVSLPLFALSFYHSNVALCVSVHVCLCVCLYMHLFT